MADQPLRSGNRINSVDRRQCEQLCCRSTRNLLATFPLADNTNRDIQMSSKNGLAYIGFGANTPDSGGAQLAYRGQTGCIEFPHGLLVDPANAVEVAGILVK